jgi:hypothetical protein
LLGGRYEVSPGQDLCRNSCIPERKGIIVSHSLIVDEYKDISCDQQVIDNGRFKPVGVIVAYRDQVICVVLMQYANALPFILKVFHIPINF